MVMAYTNGKNWEFYLSILYTVTRLDNTTMYIVFHGIK